jgi:hypothetical protein
MISTFNITTAINQGGKASSSSRAMLKVWVEVDGHQMEPGQVVYSDRLQATGLTLNLTCQTSTPGETCTVGGDAVLELFQQTKEANSFTFFLGTLGATIHSVVVKAQMSISAETNRQAACRPLSPAQRAHWLATRMPARRRVSARPRFSSRNSRTGDSSSP